MSSAEIPREPPRIHLLSDDPEISWMARGLRRWQNCIQIADTARRYGLAATAESVNRNYAIWVRWAEGRLLTGYLINQTGVKRINTKG